MDWLFNPKFSKDLTYPEALSLLRSDPMSAMDSFFGDSPFQLWFNHYDELFAYIRKRKGLKLRVAVTSIGQLTHLTRTLVSLADFVVFSPAPLWPSCRFDLIGPWPEFSLGGFKHGPIYGDASVDTLAWLAAARPLIESGQVQYLPLYGLAGRRWEYQGLELPDLPQPFSDGKITTREAIIAEAFNNLYIDQLASAHLRSIHVLPSLRSGELAIPSLQDISTQGDLPPYALLRLRIPYVHRISYAELAKIRQDEADAFAAFRKGVDKALAVLPSGVATREDLDRAIAAVQHDLIDEPLHRLDVLSHDIVNRSVEGACLTTS
jgi:hypothetical protein